MFKIGDYVVYKRDVCKICNMKVFNDKVYYVMHPIMHPIDDETLTINVPVDNNIGYLRPVLTKQQADELISNISNIDLSKGT